MSQLAVHPPIVRRAVHRYKQETTFRRATSSARWFKRRLDWDVVRNLAMLRDMIAYAADFGNQLERPFLRGRALKAARETRLRPRAFLTRYVRSRCSKPDEVGAAETASQAVTLLDLLPGSLTAFQLEQMLKLAKIFMVLPEWGGEFGYRAAMLHNTGLGGPAGTNEIVVGALAVRLNWAKVRARGLCGARARLALQALYEEVSLRPGNQAALAAQEHFEATAAQ
jgi:hypothetical protein